MDKFSFVKDGVISKLPPGFRFQPTDKEIVFQYLARKIFSYPLPASVIPEITISSTSGPWNFPTGDSDQDRYFFINKANYWNRNRTIIPTRAGFWRAIDPEKRIVCSKTMPLVGIKRTLVFYKGKNTLITRTDWIMHEYCINALTGTNTAAACPMQQKTKISPGSLIPVGNWVLCHLFTKKTGDKGETGYGTGLGSYSTSSSSSSSSSMDSDTSSILTEVSSDIASNDETN